MVCVLEQPCYKVDRGLESGGDGDGGQGFA